MIDQETNAELQLVYQALIALRNKDQNWRSNVYVFSNMDPNKAMCWWRHVQRQVDLGLLSMQPLVLEVIKQKMIG